MSAQAERFLLIGDENDLEHLFPILEHFPREAQGNVVLELPTPFLPEFPRPVDMALTLLPRGRNFAECLHERGERAASALEAWATEWLLPESSDGSDHGLWVGMVGVPAVDRVCHHLLHTVPGLHMHRPVPLTSDLGI